MGTGRYGTLFVPTLVESLMHERISSVSCGNSTTIACTEIKYEWVGDHGEKFRAVIGGRVYVAGSGVVLGTGCDSFTLLTELVNTPIKQSSAGYQHTALISADGELYCWGSNKNGCCGVSQKFKFLPKPTLVKCLYSQHENLSLGRSVQQIYIDFPPPPHTHYRICHY